MSPYLKDDELLIPHDSDPKYHHWSGGQPIIATLGELDAPASTFKKYAKYFEPSGNTCKCGQLAQITSQVFYCVPCGAWWDKV
jgi:hypothetical protein